MYVLEINKNVISVNKLCKTNDVMVQICQNTFQMKDLSMGTTLLNGKVSEWVYEWPANPSSSILDFFVYKVFAFDLALQIRTFFVFDSSSSYFSLLFTYIILLMVSSITLYLLIISLDLSIFIL